MDAPRSTIGFPLKDLQVAVVIGQRQSPFAKNSCQFGFDGCGRNLPWPIFQAFRQHEIREPLGSFAVGRLIFPSGCPSVCKAR